MIIPELYKDSLVVLDGNQLITKSLNESPLISAGNNKRKILLIVDDKNASFLSEEPMNFLTGILTACKLTMEDIVLLNIDKNRESGYEALMKAFKPSIVINFGIKLADLGYPLQFPYYQLQQYNKQTYLSAPPLTELSAQVAEKKKLWACLKTLFSI
jgi:hypothetical protein